MRIITREMEQLHLPMSISKTNTKTGQSLNDCDSTPGLWNSTFQIYFSLPFFHSQIFILNGSISSKG